MANTNANRHLRLLCFDGGGVRGLSSLYILKQLMETVNRTSPPKPCNFFHMIGGTSTGGLIAIMLGRLEMSVDDCITAYIDMMDAIFKKKQHRADVRGKVQARFDTAQLEKSIKKVIRDYSQEHDENILMRVPDVRCKVFVCATPYSIANESSVQFSSYQREQEPNSELFDQVKLWEVCRATAAGSTFFDPIKIGRNQQEFLDGATRSNNPIKPMWYEAEQAFGEDFEDHLQCVVSIGTGESGLRAFGRTILDVAETLKILSTETEQVWKNFKSDHRNLARAGRLYRWNVQRGLEAVGLEDARSRSLIVDATQNYMGTDDMREILKAFKDISSHIESTSPLPPLIRPRSQAHDYQTLDNSLIFVNHKAIEDSYWSRLTIDALLVYEKVWKAIRNKETGFTDYPSFYGYFSSLNPRPAGLTDKLVEKVWKRLPLDGEDAVKDFVLAAVYMIHMESLNPSRQPNFSPTDPSQFSYTRNKFLKHYANWVRCACGCERLWSFANGIEGLKFDRWKRQDRECHADISQEPQQSRGWLAKMLRPGAEDRRKEIFHNFNHNRVDWNKDKREEDRVQLNATF